MRCSKGAIKESVAILLNCTKCSNEALSGNLHANRKQNVTTYTTSSEKIPWAYAAQCFLHDKEQ